LIDDDRLMRIYKEYPGSTDATETTAIRARVDGFVGQLRHVNA
jgi:hypothetical protein